MIAVKDLRYGYPKKEFEVTDFTINPGSFNVVIGKNGVGKTTLLKTILGIIPFKNGALSINGLPIHKTSIEERSRLLSYVATRNEAIAHISVKQLTEIGNEGVSPSYIQSVLSQLHISHLQNQRLETLSDGELQKTYIARALIQNTPYIVLDEPVSHLDINARLEIFLHLKHLAHEQNRGIICSTHDLELALRIADKILLLSPDGKNDSGCPEDLVLSGKIAEQFNTQDVAFNPKSGAFDFCFEPKNKISVYGKGVRLKWLANALYRNAFTIEPAEEQKAQIVVEKDHFVIGAKKFNSIEELLGELKNE